MFGIKPGAMSDASLSDKLLALGAALGGDMQSVQSIRDRNEREKLASLLAAELQTGSRRPQVQAQPEPVQAAPIDPMGQASADVMSRLQGSSGLMEAPKVSAPAINPVSVQLPQGNPDQRGLFDRMLPMLVQAAGKGMDVNGLMSLVRNEDYVRGLPQKDQSAARLDPARDAGWRREDGQERLLEVNPGNVLTGYTPATRETREIFAAPNKPVLPTVNGLAAEALLRRQRGEPPLAGDDDLIERFGERAERAPPREPRVTPRQAAEERFLNGTATARDKELLFRPDPNSPEEIARRYAAAGAGDPTGDEAPTRKPEANKGNPVTNFVSGLFNRDDDREPAPQAKPKPPARPAAPAPNLPKKTPAAPAKPAGGPVRVKSVAEARALKPGTVFITPDGRRKVR